MKYFEIKSNGFAGAVYVHVENIIYIYMYLTLSRFVCISQYMILNKYNIHIYIYICIYRHTHMLHDFLLPVWIHDERDKSS